MFKTLSATNIFITASALLFFFAAGIPTAKAEGNFGYANAQQQARNLVQQGDVAGSGFSRTPVIAGAVSYARLDAQEQARRLITGPVARTNEAAPYVGALLVLEPQAVDIHKQIEHVLSAPLPL